jgi:sugar phosphate isomerase/epimerase
VERLVADLDRAGAVLRAAGQVLCYHNHGVELMKCGEGTMLDFIYAKTDPRNLQGELDTYWIQHGGGDPVEWCLRLKGRLPLLHIKDYTVQPDGVPTFASIGAGNLNWPAILGAAEFSGCEWFIVEQDTTPGDPFDAVRASLDFIRDKLMAG